MCGRCLVVLALAGLTWWWWAGRRQADTVPAPGVAGGVGPKVGT